MGIHLSTLLPQHGYGIAFLGALFEGETILVLAGLAANRGYLWWPVVVLLGALGGFIGDQIYFFIGRKYGAHVLARFTSLRTGAAHVEALIARYPHWVVIGVRFTYGLRIAGPMAIGMSKMHWMQFAMLNALGAIVWSSAWVGLGYVAGTALEAAIGNLKHVEHVIFGVALVVAVVVSVYLHWRRRKAQ